MYNSTSSHMPRSIFPDIPPSRHAATLPPNYLDPTVQARPTNTRRHTTNLLDVRREARPLRSSPLAGPSLALSQDGVLAEAEAAQKARVRSVSTSEVHKEADAADALVESPVNDFASPTSSLSGHALSAPEIRTSPLDTSISSRIKRLSLSLKRRSFSTLPTQPDISPVAPRLRRLSSSSSHSRRTADASPVPEVPQWARGTEQRSATNPPSPTDKRQYGHRRRPSTSPSTTSASLSSKRQSIVPVQLPNTSRNPEENWLTSASAPRFSRLGLKADGVVMPVSVKEARRRSTASVSSRASTNTWSVKGKQSTMSLRSINNPSPETAQRMAEAGGMQPPRPLFRDDANTSSSSLSASLTDTDSILTETRSISRLSSMTDGELPPMSSTYAEEHKSSSTLELRINDVTIDMINYQPAEQSMPQYPSDVGAQTTGIGANNYGKGEEGAGDPSITKMKRRGTLKKVWNRVVKSVTG